MKEADSKVSAWRTGTEYEATILGEQSKIC